MIQRYKLQQVSGALRAAGLPSARWISSKQVRGWGNWQSGFKVERGRGEAAIYVSYREGRWATPAESVHLERIEAAIKALEAKGIEWTLSDNDPCETWVITINGEPA